MKKVLAIYYYCNLLWLSRPVTPMPKFVKLSSENDFLIFGYMPKMQKWCGNHKKSQKKIRATEKSAPHLDFLLFVIWQIGKKCFFLEHSRFMAFLALSGAASRRPRQNRPELKRVYVWDSQVLRINTKFSKFNFRERFILA